eukprot:5487_1
MGNNRSSASKPFEELLINKSVGNAYAKLKKHENNLFDFAKQHDVDTLVSLLMEEGKLQKWTAKNVANELINGYAKHKKKDADKKGKKTDMNQAHFMDEDTENNHTTLNDETCKENYNYHYEQKQEQINIQQEVLARGQILIDATNDQITVIRKYLQAKRENKDTTTLSHLNNVALVGLKLYRGNCKILHKKQKANNEMNFSTQFAGCLTLVNEYEEQVKNETIKLQNGQEIIKRLVPLTAYMRCVINGKRPPKIPELDQEIVHNKEIVSGVMGQVVEKMNHAIPDRVKQVNQDPEKFARDQRDLAERGKSYPNKQVIAPKVSDLHQDISEKMSPPKTKKEMQQILAGDKKVYAHTDQENKIYDEMHGDHDAMSQDENDNQTECGLIL